MNTGSVSQTGASRAGYTGAVTAPRQRWRRSWRRFARNRSAVVGLVLVVGLVAVALLAPYITPFPHHVGPFVDFANTHRPPGGPYLFGTDEAGRDIFTRTIYGIRYALLMPLVVLGISVPVGVLLGLIAGYFKGFIELVIMRFTDMVLAIPPLALALAITAVLEPDLLNTMLALTFIWWTWHARLIHGIVSSLRSEDYIQACRVMGASRFHILFRELLPNCVSAIIVKTTLDIAFVIEIAAGLSFLGLGVRPPTPALGTMVANGVTYLPHIWWGAVFPGLAILLLVVAFSLLGEGLRDLLDVEV